MDSCCCYARAQGQGRRPPHRRAQRRAPGPAAAAADTAAVAVEIVVAAAARRRGGARLPERAWSRHAFAPAFLQLGPNGSSDGQHPVLSEATGRPARCAKSLP
mmetsp:Transcript_12576/g.36741  ORF Transcript_12576/g.36741 Transcript_12576/m.36741 type:complete len:103 (+) Transcript_12576:300-608(+)